MELSSQILSDITVHMKYARYLPDKKRRETWRELVSRNKDMHIRSFPELREEIEKHYQYVYDKKVLPSMRGLQFGGKPIEISPNRMFNCSYCPINHWKVFGEIMFLLLGGSGVGYSVQKHHVEELPEIKSRINRQRRFLVSDSIEGWADAVKALVKSYFFGQSKITFDLSDIRKKGARLVTSGGIAPGPQPLKDCLHNLSKILDSKAPGEKLTTLECHDIINYIADAVLSGGIRRAALISIFSIDDEQMLSCKHGQWWEENPQRGRANNSALILRHRITEKRFEKLWERIKESKTGEPGISFSNNKDWGVNPCQPDNATLLTPEGITTIGKVKVGDTIWSGKRWTTVVDKASTGIKEVSKYHTGFGVFTGTSNHRIVENGVKTEVEFAAEIDFSKGPVSFGDKFTVEETEESKKIFKTFRNLILVQISKRDLYRKNKAARIFLRGMFSAYGEVVDGSVVISLKTCNVARDTQEMLSSLGIKSFYFEDGLDSKDYKLCISEDASLYRDLIGFVHPEKIKDLEKVHGLKGTDPSRYFKISKIEKIGKHEVFRLTVDAEEHTYWTGGLLVANCGEASLRPYQFCNLCTINVSNLEDQEDFNRRAEAAAFIGTLQASYTNFHYLRSVWKKNTEKDALLGLSMTGIASGKVFSLSMEEAINAAMSLNKEMSKRIGINPAARVSMVKPEGTSSLVLGCSSGIHAWHSPFYIRRLRVLKTESIYKYLKKRIPQLVEDDFFKGEIQAIISIPIKSPQGALFKSESSIDILERIKEVNKSWIKPGHVSGENTHNVSATVYISEDEWESTRDWMWKNRKYCNGITVLPQDGGTYKQAPFEEISEDTFNEMSKLLKSLDLKKVTELEDFTNLKDQAACSAGGCEI